MERQEIKSKIIDHFRLQIQQFTDSSKRPNIQMGNLYHLFDDQIKDLPHWQHNEVYAVVHEVVQDLINAGDRANGLCCVCGFKINTIITSI